MRFSLNLRSDFSVGNGPKLNIFMNVSVVQDKICGNLGAACE